MQNKEGIRSSYFMCVCVEMRAHTYWMHMNVSCMNVHLCDGHVVKC